jgi:hypothetical protein
MGMHSRTPGRPHAVPHRRFGGWEAKAEEVVVWYYRANCQKNEEELRADIDQPELKHSSFKEVEEWINESRM